MAMTITPQTDTEFETSGRRRKVTKFALAGVAILGVGAALTSAAWTDNVWFGGSASSGVIELSGSLTGADGSFVAADTEALRLTVDNFVLGPDVTVTERVWIRNDGSLPLSFDIQDPVVSGALFDAAGLNAVVSVVDGDADDELAPGQQTWIDLTVTTPDWDESTGQGQLALNNTIRLEVRGSTDVA